MRARALLAGAVVAVGVLAPALPASADTAEKEVKECILERAKEIQAGLARGEKLSQIDVAKCEQAPNPLLPTPNEIIWGVISFGVVFVLLAKVGFPAMKKGLAAREDRIRNDLESAEAAKQEADSVLDEYRRQLADARGEAGRIIEEARQAADAMRREIQARAEEDAAEIRARAQSEIDQTVARARADLQREVANFAVTLAERVVERNLDREAQRALIDRYIEEVGGMRPNGHGSGQN